MDQIVRINLMRKRVSAALKENTRPNIVVLDLLVPQPAEQQLAAPHHRDHLLLQLVLIATLASRHFLDGQVLHAHKLRRFAPAHGQMTWQNAAKNLAILAAAHQEDQQAQLVQPPQQHLALTTQLV